MTAQCGSASQRTPTIPPASPPQTLSKCNSTPEYWKVTSARLPGALCRLLHLSPPNELEEPAPINWRDATCPSNWNPWKWRFTRSNCSAWRETRLDFPWNVPEEL